MISKIIDQRFIDQAQDTIEDAEKFVIVAHVGPDGDAVGSSLGMWHFLMALEKEPVVILPNAFPAFLSWLPGADKILIYEKDKKNADAYIAEADIIFALDFNTPKRMSKLADAILASSAKKIMLDHHLFPDDFANIIISYPEISSTSEIVFRFICRMGNFSKINLACAECIYTGMMTDTGGFTYNSNHRDIYSIIYELLKIGIDKDDIYRKVYNNYSADRMKLMGYSLYEKMHIYPEYKTALITLTAKELQQFNYITGDAEGFVNIPLSIKGIVFSVFMREDTDKIKISFRSQGSFPANEVANDVFKGGGHLNAAGAESYTTLEEARQIFEQSLPNYVSYLEEENL